MSPTDQRPVPEEILEEIRALVRDARADAVLRYAEHAPALVKGFRLTKTNVPRIRKRILARIKPGWTVDPALSELLDETSLNFRLTCTLSDELFGFLFPCLLVLCGRDKLLAAMLLDLREEIRDLAWAFLEDDDPDLPAPDDARELAGQILGPFLDLVAEWELDGAREEPRPVSGDANASSSEVAELEQRLKEVSGKLQRAETEHKREDARRRRKLKVLVGKNEGLTKEIQKANRELQKSAREKKDGKQALREMRARITEVEKGIDDSVRRGVDKELSSSLRRWMARPTRVEKEAARRDGGTDLVARAQSLLSRQAQKDRHSGNLAVIRERIEGLRETLLRVRTAGVEALHPLPELQAVEGELESEILRLEKLIGVDDRDENPFVDRMLARINAAPEEELSRLKLLLDELGDSDALDRPRLQQLYRCYNDRMGLLYAAYTPKVVRKDHHTGDPLWRLTNAVERNEEVIVFLDGHNVVHLLPEIFGETYEQGVPGKDTRRKLVDLMLAATGDSPNCRIEVFFDGPSRSSHRHSGNVQEVYSGGGQGENRADNAIVEHLEYCCRQMSAMPRILVTDDRDLRSKARELGADIVRVTEFGLFLEDATQG